MNILDKLTAYLIETKYESLPKDVVEATRRQILDTLGVTVAGSTCSISGEMNGLANMVRDWGGKEESTIIAFGGRVPASDAAFVNAISSVRLDFDDTLVTWVNLHASRVIVPTAFAMAERQGNIDGRELIAAIALGCDFGCRIKQASGGNKDNAVRFTSNFFGAAATAAKLLGLDHERFQNALFLAFHQMCGAGGSGGGGIHSRTSLKGVSDGFAAKAGIISALMAEKGFTAAPDFLEAENKENYYEIFCGGARVKEMARKVKPGIDKAMAREQGFPPAAVEIKTGAGKVYSRQVDSPFGTPGNPMTFADVALKFKECCRFSVNPIPTEKQEKVIRMVEELEKMEDVGRIVRLLG